MRLNFYHCMAVSLLLHAAIAVPFVFMGLHKADHARHNKLAIELFGMISDRQMEEKHKGGNVPRPSPQPIPQRVARRAARPAPRQTSDRFTTELAQSPVQVEKADGKEHQTDDETGPSAPSLPAASARAGGDAEQRQQTIGYENRGVNVIAEYLAKVSRRLQANLVYPEETRKRGLEGVSTVSFTITESGTIREGSLKVRKTSGYAALDSNALKSALASSPFEKPPKEMTVRIAVEFNVEVARTKRASVR
jgi:protein TonB